MSAPEVSISPGTPQSETSRSNTTFESDSNASFPASNDQSTTDNSTLKEPPTAISVANDNSNAVSSDNSNNSSRSPGSGMSGSNSNFGDSDSESDDKNASRLSVDRYGFITNEADAVAHSPASVRRASIALENSRSDKWVKMLKSWDRYKVEKYDKLKRRVRKGIPDRCRGQAWSYFVDTKERRAKFPTKYYEDLVLKGNDEFREVIERDLSRTFPKHEWFREKGGKGQQALYNVLIALASHNPEVGYCQGMGFVTAMALSYLSEEDAFWLMMCLMEKLSLDGLFAPGFPRLRSSFYVLESLLEQHYPKIGAHLEKEQVDMSLYASQWFLTMFINMFPFPVVLRIWDMFLFEGWKIFFRVALLILKFNEKLIMGRSFDSIIMSIKDFCENPEMKDENWVITNALRIDVATKEVDDLYDEYRGKNPGVKRC
eukprot:ANDGO_08079.mRNA.1 Ecotropic viral integration site 5 ortholog